MKIFKLIIVGALFVLPSSQVMAMGSGLFGMCNSVDNPALYTNSGDLTADANCQFAQSYEDVLTDSSGEGNTVTVVGTTTYDATNLVKSGSKSFGLNGSSYLYRAASGISANFPGIAASSAFSAMGWFRLTNNVNATHVIISKGQATSGFVGKESWSVLTDTNGKLAFSIYSDGASATTFTGSTTLSINTDYFFCAIWTGTVTKLFLGWNGHHPTSQGSDVSFSSTLYTNATDGEGTLTLGTALIGGSGYGFITGNIEDIGVFNDVVTQTEYESAWAHGLNGAK